MEHFFTGRKLVKSEIPPNLIGYLAKAWLCKIPAMEELQKNIQCLRCGSIHRKEQVRLGRAQPVCYYCPSCIQFGRIQSNQWLYQSIKKEPKTKKSQSKCEWVGKLTASQNDISKQLIATVKEKKDYLIYAVTGAGKTEMLFPLIEYGLFQGKRIAVATPRVDVCIELFPRLQAAFPKMDSILLYGGQEEVYRYTQLVICTTHQLMRFENAFDLLIIDEIDAFPFAGNQMLAYGVKQAKKQQASTIFLTATPNKQLKKMMAQGLAYGKLPARFHQHPLPVPQVKWLYQWQKKIQNGEMPFILKQILDQQFKSKDKCLLFCPTIQLTDKMANLLSRKYPNKRIMGVHAADSARKEKVAQMREGAIDLLITTTILERGVTFKGVNVIVYGANHRVFQTATLVQISGRVGRNVEKPNGTIYFIHDGRTKAMQNCIKQIKKMNQLAVSKGLLKK